MESSAENVASTQLNYELVGQFGLIPARAKKVGPMNIQEYPLVIAIYFPTLAGEKNLE